MAKENFSNTRPIRLIAKAMRGGIQNAAVISDISPPGSYARTELKYISDFLHQRFGNCAFLHLTALSQSEK